MKNRVIGAALAAFVAGIPGGVFAQTPPQIVKDNLPKKAECWVCSQSGEAHGEEKPAGALAYKGKTYYFCSKNEMAAFSKDPESYLPAPLPRPAPAFTLKNVAGNPVTLAELGKDKILLVDFWATWCGPCIKAMPEMQKIHEKYAAQGFSVVGVSIDEEGAKKVAPFLARQKVKYTYPILLDTAENNPVWKEWGVKAVPSVLLVKEGKILRHWSGKVNLQEMENAVAAALKTSPAP